MIGIRYYYNNTSHDTLTKMIFKSNPDLKNKYQAGITPAIIQDNVDLEKVKSAAKLLVGEHDFVAFSSTGSCVNTTVRKVYSVKVEKRGIDVKISITGNGFLYNMVRIICGTLLEIGLGKRAEQDIINALSSGNRKFAGKTLSAKGLCLKQVKY